MNDEREDTENVEYHERPKETSAIPLKEEIKPEPPEDKRVELEKGLHEKDLLIADLENKIKYLIADFENFKKFASREKEQITRFASEAIVKQLLPIIDSLERATATPYIPQDTETLLNGIKIIYAQLMDVLGKWGLTAISAVGKQFDPYRHEALMQIEDLEKDDNVVIEEFEKGYMLCDKVIRTAKVKVNKRSDGQSEREKQDSEVSGNGKDNRH
jgi:molecular chaperone GrpE